MLMEPLNELRFTVSDRINDAEVGLKHVPLVLLGDFQKDVSEFLRGSSRDVDLGEVLVSLEEGSLVLFVFGLLSASTLWADLENLQSNGDLNLIDPKRAAVVERWQKASQDNPHRKYGIADAKSGYLDLTVDLSTNFRRVEDVWVTVEKYVHGKVLDMGGKTKPNVHLELADGNVLMVSATQKLLEQQEQNLLYRSILLHITAEENLRTGALRNPLLLSFETHDPSYSEAEFQEMVRRGTAAWSDVPNATEWLDGMRGGHA